jgi:hypothetical protein
MSIVTPVLLSMQFSSPMKAAEAMFDDHPDGRDSKILKCYSHTGEGAWQVRFLI